MDTYGCIVQYTHRRLAAFNLNDHKVLFPYHWTDADNQSTKPLTADCAPHEIKEIVHGGRDGRFPATWISTSRPVNPQTFAKMSSPERQKELGDKTLCKSASTVHEKEPGWPHRYSLRPPNHTSRTSKHPALNAKTTYVRWINGKDARTSSKHSS